MPIQETQQICAPCKNGDHKYCVINRYTGLLVTIKRIKTRVPDYLIYEVCFCNCKKE